MSAASRAEIKTRAELILSDITGLSLLTGAEEKVNPAVLPAVRVTMGGSRHQRISMYQRLVTHDITILVLVKFTARGEVKAERIADIEACDAWLDLIPDVLTRHPRMERGDAGIVRNTGEVSNTNAGLVPYLGDTYTGFAVTWSATVQR